MTDTPLRRLRAYAQSEPVGADLPEHYADSAMLIEDIAAALRLLATMEKNECA